MDGASSGVNDGKLLPQHLADLRKSGLSDVMIEAAGVDSVTDPAEIGRILKWKYPAKKLGACLRIPFPHRDGKRSKFARLRPDTPRVKDGKPCKYESPKGGGNYPYFPPGISAALSDPAAVLLITEGEKKALKAMQEGLPCVGLVGVDGWSKARPRDASGKKKGPRELLPDLESVAWKGRTVYIVYDSDATTKDEVRFAEYKLAEALRKQGANALAVRLPAGEGGAKVGLDDYLVDHGPHAFRELLKTAKPPEKPKRPAPTEPNDGITDPHRLAAGYLKTISPEGSPHTLHYYRGEWLRYDGTAYAARSDAEVRAGLVDWIRGEFVRVNLLEVQQWADDGGGGERPETRPVTGKLAADAEQALRSICLLPDSIEAPAWIGAPGEPEAARLMPLKNGLLDLEAAASGKPALYASTPAFFALNSAPYDYYPDATEPTHWLTFAAELWPNDQQSIDTLQEWMGLMLTPDTRHQKILFILGPKRSGKGTIARVMRDLLGPANVAGPTLGSLATNFGLSPLVGKPAAIISDAHLSGRSDAAIITERLKAISGEDAITIDRKHRDPITVKLPTRFTILANELPRLGDASGALASRLIMLRLTRTWYGRENHDLSARLQTELPGILRWAIEGWRRLRDRGRLIQPDSAREIVEDMDALSSPIGVFVRDKCIVSPGESVVTSELFAAWRSWCEAHGRDHPGNEQSFGRDLRAAVASLGTVSRKAGSERWREYSGIRIRTATDDEDEFGHPDTRGHASLPLHASGSEVISKVEIRSLDEVEAAIDGLACPRVPGVSTTGGWGTCRCGKPALSMTCRVCRSCLDAEASAPVPR